MLLALVLLGCPEPKTDDSGTACAEYAASSVTVNVTDLAGDPLRPDAVTYTVDGGPPSEAQPVNEEGTQWVAGYEIAGEITVTATLNRDTEDGCCQYDAEASETVTIGMTEDGCHVEGQTIALALDTDNLVCADTGCG
ncbi:MAG: hypothetical protein ACOZNI_36035 [Myxococcota bacterium]